MSSAPDAHLPTIAPSHGRLGRLARQATARALRGLASVRFARFLGAPLYTVLRTNARPAGGLAAARRILLVRLDRIGDVTLTFPLVRELRRNAPHAELVLVVRPELSNLAARCPHVDRVVAFDPEATGTFRRLVLHGRALRLAATQLWSQRPDLAVLPRFDADIYHATFLMYFSGARRRIAYSEHVGERKTLQNTDYDLLLTDPIVSNGVKHEVQRNLDLLRALGGDVANDELELWLTDEDREFARRAIARVTGAGDAPLIALGVGASATKRRWPIERYAELAVWLKEQFGARLVVLGGPGEEALGAVVSRVLGNGCLDLVGRTTLGQAAAVLERASLFVGNDTGTMHLAAAVHTPVVAISCHPRSGLAEHPNSPVRFGPWGVPSRVLQPADALAPCVATCESEDAHCIALVDVESVGQAVLELSSETRAAREAPPSRASA